MSNNRREFMKLSAATASATGLAWAATPAAAQTAGQFKGVKALAFDAYGTLPSTIGTYETSTDVRYTAAFGGKATASG